MKITSLTDQVEISEDKTYNYLRKLLREGYDTVTFTTHPGACPKCSFLEGSEWSLTSFLKQNTVPIQDRFQGAPFFGHFHPNAKGKIIVSGETSDGILKDIVLTYKKVLNPNDIGELKVETLSPSLRKGGDDSYIRRSDRDDVGFERRSDVDREFKDY